MNALERFQNFLKASALRIAAEAPPFWERMKFYLNWLIGILLALQPEAVNFVNNWAATGLKVSPWMEVALRILAGAAVGARFLSNVPISESSMSRKQQERLEELEAMALSKNPPPLK